ncbi:MAG: stalk domain-containing protein [Caldisericia bacterium]|nr:stalk domain-containing protein [Caldisericia bacterium]
MCITTLRSNGTSIIEGPLESNYYTIHTSLGSPKVLVRPEQVGLNAEYHLILNLGSNGELLANSGRIDVTFPDGTIVPSSISSSSIRVSSSVSEPAFPCGTGTGLSFDPQVVGNKVSFVVPVTIPSNNYACITFQPSAGIINPTTPGNYTLKISTSTEPSVISSSIYSIKAAGTSSVVVEPNKSREVAAYTIHFKTGVNGALYPYGTAGTDKNIMITFPAGFVLPATIAAGIIRVNGIGTSDPATIVGQKITFPTPIVIDNNKEVTIEIQKQAGVTNPNIKETPEYYNLIIETDKEKDSNRISSDAFIIYTSVKDVIVVPTDPGTGIVSRYDITFETGDVDTGLESNDSLFVEFPAGTVLPAFIASNNIQIVRVVPNDIFYPSSVFVQGQKISITLPVGFVLAEVSKIKITFLQSAGIRNPDTPGSYRVTVYTSKENLPIASNLYTIGSVAGDVQVRVSPNVSKYCSSSADGAEYTVRFLTGASGGVSVGQNLYVIFPPEYTAAYLPPVIPAGRILVNGILTSMNAAVDAAPTPQFSPGSRRVTIPTPVYIANQAYVEINFLASANIDNPIVTITPQPYYLSVYTDPEPSAINGIYYLVSTISGIGGGCNLPVGVTVVNQYAGSGSAINLQFQTGPVGSLTAGSDKIFIKLPEGTKIPTYMAGTYVTINVGVDNFATSVSVLNPKVVDRTIEFSVPYGMPAIGADTPVYIYISQAAGLVNPSIPGNYNLTVWTSKEITEVKSIEYNIQYVATTKPAVDVLPNFVNAEAAYSIKFFTGSYGGINIGDPIYMIFPTGTVLPDPGLNPISPRYITVNGVACVIGVTVVPATRSLTIYSPVMIAGNSSVSINISKDAKIINPPIAGEQYTLQVWTLREGSSTNPFISSYYKIISANRPTVAKVTITPCTPFSNVSMVFGFYTPVAMTAEVDYFEINFPSDTFIPSTVNTNTILVNNTACQTSPIINLYKVTVYPSNNIAANDYVSINFTKAAGLQNPGGGSVHASIRLVAPGAGSASDTDTYYICPDLNFGRLEIIPAGTRMQIGKTQTFTARAFDSDGVKMDVGVVYRWSVTSGIGVIDNVTKQTIEFFATNTGVGTMTVNAEYGSKVMSTSVSIVVLGLLDKIILQPQETTTSRGKTTRFNVQATDSNGEALDNVNYFWSVSPSIGTVKKITGSNDIEFLAEKEGTCILKVTASQGTITKEAQSTIIIKNGVNNLKWVNTNQVSIGSPSDVLGPFSIKLVNEMGMELTETTETSIQILSSSSTTRFSVDGLNWSKANSIIMTVSVNFSETLPFYIAEINPNNISIIATSANYNSAVMPLSIRGNVKTIMFMSAPQSLRIQKPSEVIKVQVSDIYGTPVSLNSDMLFALTTKSTTGSFSRTQDPFVPVTQIVAQKGSSTIEFYYKDNSEGTYSITIANPLLGSAVQMVQISSPGSVSAPEVTVSPPIQSASAEYKIRFSTGIDGELKSFQDTIKIQFPAGTGIPAKLNSQQVFVNGKPLIQAPIVDAPKYSLTFYVPELLTAGSSVEIIIKDIINPAAVNVYYLQVQTSMQPTPSVSKGYKIDVSSLSRITVKANPIITGMIAEYEVQFKTGLRGQLSSNDEIFFVFDTSHQIPNTIGKQNVLLNGVPLGTDPTVDGKTISIKVEKTILPDTMVTVVFTKEAKIQNPMNAGTYKLKVYTTKEMVLIESAPFEIVQNSSLKNLKMQVTPATINTVGQYTITMNLGPYGSLTEEDKLYIILTDLVLPKSITPSSIAINQIRLTKQITVSDQTIMIPIPMAIQNDSSLTVVIYDYAGIMNPPKPGDNYRISAYTSKEPLPVVSEPYSIEPTLQVNYFLSPTQADGNNGYYKTAPTLLFTSNVIGKIYFSMDGEAEKLYQEPVLISEAGDHTISYYCISSLGSRSSEQVIHVKVDATPPMIECNIVEDILYTRLSSLAFTLRITDDTQVSVTMNDKAITLIDRAFSTMITLEKGENIIVVKAIDEAGNTSMLIRRIILKTTPPVLLVTSPAIFQTVESVYFATTSDGTQLFANVRFAGSVEIGIERIKILSTTTGYETEIVVDGLGNFDKVLGIRSLAGDNNIQVIAVDKVGNETKVTINFMLKTALRLRIGNATAYLNGNALQMDVKPYLKYNMHTMVPFRIIAESIGAMVGWDGATRKVSYEFRGIKIFVWIGSKQAQITDATGKTRNLTMLAEPEIINGRTLIPLRFVSEALGAKVDWNAKLWEATVSYP